MSRRCLDRRVGGSVSVNISTFSADQAALDKVSGGFTIGHCGQHFLGAEHARRQQYLSITISDDALIGASIAQLTSDAAAIGKLADQSATPVTFAVTDTAAHITAALNSLNGSISPRSPYRTMQRSAFRSGNSRAMQRQWATR